jgi:hypothetical protein
VIGGLVDLSLRIFHDWKLNPEGALIALNGLSLTIDLI